MSQSGFRPSSVGVRRMGSLEDRRNWLSSPVVSTSGFPLSSNTLLAIAIQIWILDCEKKSPGSKYSNFRRPIFGGRWLCNPSSPNEVRGGRMRGDKALAVKILCIISRNGKFSCGLDTCWDCRCCPVKSHTQILGLLSNAHTCTFYPKYYDPIVHRRPWNDLKLC